MLIHTHANKTWERANTECTIYMYILFFFVFECVCPCVCLCMYVLVYVCAYVWYVGIDRKKCDFFLLSAQRTLPNHNAAI